MFIKPIHAQTIKNFVENFIRPVRDFNRVGVKFRFPIVETMG